jgi:sigma-B regulation protein RsbU (phosphoserine phosphatase)
MPFAADFSIPAPQTMQCMEVWGGNQPVENTVHMPGLDAWVFSRPYLHADAGGDVYYASSCATGRIVRLLLADVSGHGSAVCDIAGLLRSLMRSHVNRLSQTSFVREMNQQFTTLSAGGCFATAIVSTFFAPTNQLTLCNAGHPAPLLFRAKTSEWSLLKPLDKEESPRETEIWNLPLGIEDTADYEQFGIQLELGDIVLCYSDSLTEAKNATGQMLGESGLLQFARTLPGDNPSTLITRLLKTLADQNRANLSDDDVTILMFRATTTTGQLSPLRTRLLGPLRVLRETFKSIRDKESLPLPDFSLANLGGALFAPFNRLRCARKKG